VKVLLATSTRWASRLYPPLKERYDVVPVYSFEEAERSLGNIDVAVVGFHFDERRPDRLLRLLQERQIPAFCVRGLPAGVPDDVLAQIEEAYRNELGCRDFIHFPEIGDEKALELLYAHLDEFKNK
jgi:hypothetical protein